MKLDQRDADGARRNYLESGKRIVAALQGFEPQPTDPESVVLPLN